MNTIASHIHKDEQRMSMNTAEQEEGIFLNLSKGKRYFFGGKDNIEKLVAKGFIIDFWMDDIDYINNPPQIFKQYYCHGFLVNGRHIPIETDRPGI